MGAEESRNRRDPPNVFDVFAGAGFPPRNNINAPQSYQRSSHPSVSEFSNNPERYPGFVLVLVLSTGKMEVVTRQEANRRGARVKIVSNPSESGRSDDSSFFREESSNEDIVFEYLVGGSTNSVMYFDITTGKFGVCKEEDRHRYQRSGLLWLE